MTVILERFIKQKTLCSSRLQNVRVRKTNNLTNKLNLQ